MLARLQRLLSSSIALFCFASAIVFCCFGSPFLAPVGGLSISVGYAAFLGIELLLMRWVGDPALASANPTASQLLFAWWHETLAGPQIFCWHQPWRADRFADHLPVDGARRGVVLVHGFVCNRGFWNRWMPVLQAQRVPFIAVNLEPVFGSIDEYVGTVEAAIRRMEATTQMPPVVVGHSMGGLAIRAWLAAFQAKERVHHVVTIGSPHHGTWLARFGTSRNTREMAIGSDWLRVLQAKEEAQQGGKDFSRFSCFYSPCDNVVFPASSSTLPGANNQLIPGYAHVHLASHPEVLSHVISRVREP